MASGELKPFWAARNNQGLFLSEVRAHLQVAMQPIVDIRSGATFGFECLLRGHERMGFSSIPSIFEAAIENDCLIELELELTSKACTSFARAQHVHGATLFLNMEGRTLPKAERLVSGLMDICRRTGVAPQDLCLEISEANHTLTESWIESAVACIRDAGMQIAIDDFGIGYSGLQMLYRTQPDYLKVDRFFVTSLNKDSRKRFFTNSVVNIAHTLGIKVIAEGVETTEEHHTCRDLRCDLVQGWFVARPTTDINDLHQVYQSVADNRDWRDTRDRAEIRAHIETVTPLRETDTVEAIYQVFRDNVGQHVIPVLDRRDYPIGIIDEQDIRPLVYSLDGGATPTGGSEISLAKLMRRTSVSDVHSTPSELIDLSATSSSRGIVITENGRYLGMLLPSGLLSMANALQIGRVARQNPLTRLPGNEAIQDEMQKCAQCIGIERLFAYLDLDNFKPFNDQYGFRAGDRAILMLADLLRKTFSGPNEFAGHVGGDDFIIIASGYSSQLFVHKLSELLFTFASDAESLYSPEHRLSGRIPGTMRDGRVAEFPLMRCSAGVVALSYACTDLAPAHLSRLLAEQKKLAKLSPSRVATRTIESLDFSVPTAFEAA